MVAGDSTEADVLDMTDSNQGEEGGAVATSSALVRANTGTNTTLTPLLLIAIISTSYQPTLSTHPLIPPSHTTLSTHPVNPPPTLPCLDAASVKPSIGELLHSFEPPPRRLFHAVLTTDTPYQYILSLTHPINTHSQYTLSIHPLTDTPYQ